MFPRRALDMIILTILKEHPEGLTGYSIREKMREKFPDIRIPSAGTIYPRLHRLKAKGNIEEQGNLLLISEQGKEKLAEHIPELMEESVEFFPLFYKFLMRPLPFQSRMHYISQGPPVFRHPHGGHKHIFDESILPEDYTSIERLQKIKNRLLRAKQRIEEDLQLELQAIDAKVREIDEKIEHHEQEKQSRVKIPVEDGDSAEK
ncbi:MAG: PadR family transcriptional regulator [Promethearchaeota archaeon]|nr:MAG: PadR family transcriptional regulator [Candidatus Lokiarchaeota archaeon]